MLTLVFEHGLRAPTAGRETAVWRDDQGDTFARGFVEGGSLWIEWRDLGTFAFSLGSTMVHVWPASGTPRAVITDTFGRVLQPIILQALGWQALHASAVLGSEGAIAFCGVGRSGKSTLAYALGHDGFNQIADDAVVIEPAGEGVVMHLLPFVPGLRQPSREHFERAAGISSAGGSNLPEKTSLRAVFVLHQDESLRRPEMPHRIPPVQAFSALVTHARCFDEADPAHVRRLVADYLQVAEHIAVYRVGYPPRFAQFDDLIEVIRATANRLGVAPRKGPRPVLVR